MLIAAVINVRSLKVPNNLSLPATLAGWVVAGLVSAAVGIPSQGGGILPSLAAAGLGLFLLLPFYVARFLGAGCVKMQMAFGAWIGCALGLEPAAWLSGLATLAGGLLTLVVGIVAIMIARKRRQVDGNPVVRFGLFPAQVTLSLGSIACVAAAGLLGWI
jgi:Flp pilus assembly protein protease CpaA